MDISKNQWRSTGGLHWVQILCVFLTILRPKMEELNPSQYDRSHIFTWKNGFSLRLEYILKPFLSIMTTVHCRSLRYVAGDWQKSLWELCFLSGAQCNKGLNTDDYTKMHLNRNSSNVSVALNYLKEILII